MARGMFRGICAGALALVALQTLTDPKSGNPDKLSGLWGLLNATADRVLDPDVPAIPDHSHATAPANAPADATAGDMTNPYKPAVQNSPNAIPRVGVPQIK